MHQLGMKKGTVYILKCQKNSRKCNRNGTGVVFGVKNVRYDWGT